MRSKHSNPQQMSVSVNQILSDARRLVSRLRDHDSSTETIIHKAHILYRNVQEMKEYNEDVSEQPSMVVQREVRGSGGQENRHIRELRMENRELRALLEEHQYALELLMSKYRQRATLSLLACDPLPMQHNTQELQSAADDVCRAGELMRLAVQLDDGGSAAEQERLTQLRTENRGLREMLQISQSFGSLQPSLLHNCATEDKQVQTE